MSLDKEFNTSDYDNACLYEDVDMMLYDVDQLDSFQDDSDFVYTVLSTEELVQYMIDCIHEVSDVINTEPTITRIFLSHFNWDKEKLYEKYFDGDLDKLYHDAHIVNPHVTLRSLQQKKIYDSSCLENCTVCFNTDVEMKSLACGHQFCVDCWEAYLREKIMEEGIGHTISCPAYRCGILVDDRTVTNLIKDVRVNLRYQYFITDSFVQNNELLKWCPQPECHNAIKVQYKDMQPVSCNCGHEFCFLCTESWHYPVTCDLLKKWKIILFNDDTASINWIVNNAKECPKCNAPIEKNGGCNHMTCNNQSCRTEFCWVCLELWRSHHSGAYNCNRYSEKATSNTFHKRYLFFKDRYTNHMKSLELENGLYDSVKDKFEQVCNIQASELGMLFLKKAVDVLYQCRRTLMYTYVFAYSVKENNQLEIFLDNQSYLESATEVLSECLQQNISETTALEIKLKVQDKFRYCKSICKLLLSHVHEGYDKDWWEFM